MYCWLHFRKKAVWRASSKDEIAEICSHQDAINKCFFHGSLFVFLCFCQDIFSSFRCYHETCIIGIHLLPIGFFHVLLSDGFLMAVLMIELLEMDSP